MGTLGPNAGGTFASDSTVGAIAITNPSNAGASDNSYATSVLLLGQITNYLKVTNFNFSIPLDATITGVTVSIEKSTTLSTSITDSSVKLVKVGTISGNDKASASQWGTSDAVSTYGSNADLWGLTLTPSDINNSGFGVCISAVAGLGATAQIDFVSITIDYLGSNRSGNILAHVSVGGGMSRNDLSS